MFEKCRAYAFSDEEEETKRTIKSAKEKRYEELFTIIKQIKNFKKIKDFSKLLTAFENLGRAHQKAKSVIDKEENGVTPRFYIKCLVEMDDLINECWEDKEFKKSTNKNNAKALTTLRQKLRKYVKEGFEADVTKYRENPDAEDAEEGSDQEDQSGSESSGDEKDEDEDRKETAKQTLAFLKTGSDEESESDSDDWGSSDESSLSSDDEKYGENLAQKFLKKDTGGDKDKKKDKKEKKDRDRKRGHKIEEDDGQGEWKIIKDGTVTQEKPKMFSKDEEVTHASMLKKINEVLAMRGKKRIHRSDQIEMLSELMEISEKHNLGPAMEIKLIFALIGAVLSYNSNINPCMRPSNWAHLLRYCNRMLDILVANPDISVGERIAEDSESYVTAPFRVSGCALTLIERAEDEFTKLLQAVDAHSPDYIERLKDEKAVCHVIDRIASYLETDTRGTSIELCRVYILKIDHLYYKFDPEAVKQSEIRRQKAKEDAAARAFLADGFKPVSVVIQDVDGNEKKEDSDIKITSLDVMDRLCKYIYANDKTDRIRTQAILYHIYHHALHDNWFEARDLMLMSHLQHNIIKADIPLQIIYNRALVQLGLCSFRHGNIKDAHTALLDIQILGRAKELLAQGLLPRQQERTAEQEKQEKRRLLPFHKHINLELLECVYLVSAMLLEIPDVAANEYSIRKKMISRSFYNQLRKNEEQPLVGLPESMREHVVAASKAMRIGNWKSCQDFIINEKMNNKVWNLFHRPEKVRDMLAQKIREESLRAYLFTYSHVYDSISLEILSKIFDLDKAVTHSIISKMTTNEELMVSFIVMCVV